MNQPPQPRVSLGLPTYNGERFLAETISSILAQTFEDFELIISDDGSTDGTLALCERYAASDPRVHVSTSSGPRGPAHNFNRVAGLASGALFKWCAQDDPIEPTFLERCVDALERRPELVLAYPLARTRPATGAISLPWGSRPALESSDIATRWRDALASPRDPMPLQIFGVIRTDQLRRHRTHGRLPGLRPLSRLRAVLARPVRGDRGTAARARRAHRPGRAAACRG